MQIIAYQFIENSHFLPTFAQIAEEKPRTGLNAKITSVNFQPFVKPTINPVKNVATAWKNIPIFSPIPSLILEMSLEKNKRYPNE